MFPIIGRSLQSMLDYEGDDFDDKFGLNFTVSFLFCGPSKSILCFLCCGPFTKYKRFF